MTPNEMQTVLSYVKGLRFVWEKVQHAEEVLQAGLAIESTMAGLQRDRQAEQAKLDEVRAAVTETQRILTQAKQAVSDIQVKLENRQAAVRQAEELRERAAQDLQAAIDRGAEALEAGIQARTQAMEEDYQRRAAALQAEIDRLTRARDGLQSEMDSILNRLRG